MERGSDLDSASTPSSPEATEDVSQQESALTGLEIVPLTALFNPGVRDREVRCEVSFKLVLTR